MPDELDLVRRLFAALNRGEARAIEALYDPACVAEHVFLDHRGVVEGRAAVCARWAEELAAWRGALAGGRRYDVTRVAGIETGWGWVRAEWIGGWQPVAGGPDVFHSGHSHFWIEDGRVRRHRSVAGAPLDNRPAAVAAAERAGQRDYPSRPVVGVGAVVLTSDRQVLLVRRRHEPLAGQWSLPGGALELGETLEAGTAREILEETGVAVDVGPVVEVFDRILVDDAGRVRYHFVLVDYLCRPLEEACRPVAGSDVSDVALVPPDHLGAYRLAEKAGDVIRRALALHAAG